MAPECQINLLAAVVYFGVILQTSEAYKLPIAVCEVQAMANAGEKCDCGTVGGMNDSITTHGGDDGGKRCCLEKVCDAGTEAVLCQKDDPLTTQCAICAEGTYSKMARSSRLFPCQRHSQCPRKYGQVVKVNGTVSSDTVCQCTHGYCPVHDMHDETWLSNPLVCEECHTDTEISKGSFTHNAPSHNLTGLTTQPYIEDESPQSNRGMVIGWSVFAAVVISGGVATVIVLCKSNRNACERRKKTEKLPYSTQETQGQNGQALLHEENVD